VLGWINKEETSLHKTRKTKFTTTVQKLELQLSDERGRNSLGDYVFDFIRRILITDETPGSVDRVMDTSKEGGGMW